jgi:hypothetical protein
VDKIGILSADIAQAKSLCLVSNHSGPVILQTVYDGGFWLAMPTSHRLSSPAQKERVYD